MPLAPVRPARWDAPSDFTAEVQQHHRVHPSSHGVRVGDDIEGIPRAAFSAISSVGIRRPIAKYTRFGCSLWLVIVKSEACDNLLHDGSLPIEAACTARTEPASHSRSRRLIAPSSNESR